MSSLLSIRNLQAHIDAKTILSGVDLTIRPGETHVIMGQNGAGKSTLVQCIMGNPQYEYQADEMQFLEQNLLTLDATSRAHLGIFLSFQQAIEIPGLKIFSYLRMLYNKSHTTPLSPLKFRQFLQAKLAELTLPENLMQRSLNDGFSGGEKKKMEILQMLVLEPKLIILDEIDSGLDVDAIKQVASSVKHLQQQLGSSVLLITHYERILHSLHIDQVHLMKQGKIVQSGSAQLAQEIEEKGFTALQA